MGVKILNNRYLDTATAKVQLPEYKRSEIETGILHIGVGGFHRAHQALYTDLLMGLTNDLQWGICGVGLLPIDKKLYLTLKEQDYLYTVLMREPGGKLNATIVGALTEYIFAPDNPEAVFEKIADPKIRVISLTITEGGYNLNQVTGELNTSDSNIQNDWQHPSMPKTVYGYLREGLNRRRQRNGEPLTILSCDNIEHNGDIARKMLLSFVKPCDRTMYDWIKENVSFPNCMVDRITPVTTPDDIHDIRTSFHVVDKCPVVCEPFGQWIIEDKFAGGRPEWEKSGAQFVPDVRPYEKMKIRLLNAGHSVLGFLGSLYGYNYIHEAVSDKRLLSFLQKFMDDEVTPTLDPIPGVDLTQYKNILQERFANPFIKDKLQRICLESSAKIPKFLLATINDQLKKGGAVHHSALVIAAWCVYCMGVDDNRQKLVIEDNMAELLQTKALESRKDPLAFLKIKTIFGSLATEERFTKLYKHSLVQLLEKGVIQTVTDVQEV